MDIGAITSQKDWDRLTDQFQAPLQQRWLYGAAAERLGRTTRRIAIYNDTACIATAQTVSRKIAGVEVALATRGPLIVEACDRQRALKRIKRALPARTITVMTPVEKLRRIKLSQTPTLCMLDLSASPEDLRAKLHAKWRNGLKKAEQTRLKVVKITATPDALMPLLRAEKERQSKAAYRALPPEFALALHEVAPRSLRLFAASDAQMLFIKHGNSATYYMGHTGPNGRAQNAHNLILWSAMLALKKEGVTRLDLGTIDQKRAPNLARFKLRTGAFAFQSGAACFL